MKQYPRYNFKSIENKWQTKWLRDKTFQPDMDKVKKPFYNLMMFPYPSAEGLHVGSVFTFTGVDTFGRFKKLQGLEVFEPMGLDGFGIHSENYAMKIGQHILDVSKRTEKHFYQQLHMIGNMHDWSRTVETYKPEYYKWTQWIFLKMYEKGLAYRKKAKVNWCPSCKTVLSDEQVIAGRCERCDSLVQKKELAQWFFRITAYADRLLKNLDWIDWPEDVKTNQRNWIGKSEGALIKFPISNFQFPNKSQIQNLKSKKATSYKLQATSYVECFTTRPDTLFGATYMVVAPEHTIISTLNSQLSNLDEVEKYVGKAIHKTEEERKNDKKEKTGIELKGIKAINPATGEEIPIFVADYVLGDYGTGAIMAVPAHDERDYIFAKKYNLPIKQVVTPEIDKYKETLKTLNVLDEISRFCEEENIKVWLLGGLASAFYGGFIYRDHDDIDLITKTDQDFKRFQKVILKLGFKKKKEKQLTKNLVNIIYENKKGIGVDVGKYIGEFGLKNEDFETELKELCGTKIRVISKRFIKEFKEFQIKNRNKKKDQQDWEYLNGKVFTDDGYSINSGFLDGQETKQAKKEMVKWLEKTGNGKKSIDYKLRDWCISRQRYWGPPIPIIWCKNCARKSQISTLNSPTKVLMIHGFNSAGKDVWFPWMKKELEKIGCEVFVPTLKDAKHPKLSDWLNQLKPYLNKLDENSVIIGHSLGSKAALHFLEKSDKKIAKLFLVASAIGNPKRDWAAMKKRFPKADWESVRKFWENKVNWNKIDRLVGEKHIIVSKDDGFIDPEHYKVAKLSNLRVEKWEGQGHFTQKKNEKLKTYLFSYLQTYLRDDIEPVAVPVPQKDLPVKLPPMKDFLPEGKGKGPLAKNEKFVKTKCPVCGGEAERETDVSDPFVDSSWYFFRYPSTEFKDKPFDKKRTKKWLPVDSYIGGKEHTVLHLLYSRFVTMVFKDLGMIDFEEPYKRFFGHGLITKDGAKMSKSKGNVVNPDVMIEKYGADTVRLYLRFVGDFSQGGDWRDSGIEGMAKFVKRLWRTFFELDGSGQGVERVNMVDRTIKVIGEDIEKLSFNTAVARLMEFVNWINENINSFDKKQAQKIKETLAFVLAPMAPHIAEEFWTGLGNKKSIFESRWPKYDPKNIIEDEIDLVIQVDGKLRDRIKVSKDISENEAKKLALASEKVKKYIDGKNVRKIIYVPGRLINIVM